MTLRGADLTTFIRVGLIMLVAYLIIFKFSVVLILILLSLSLFLDAGDGFLALKQGSKNKISLLSYIRYISGKKSKRITETKRKISKIAPWGPRMDIAGDRITEYTLWIVFTFLHILPIFVIFLIIIRHSFTDAFMAARGTSSQVFSNFSRIFYTSNWSRATINILKFVTFAYLILVYIMKYPVYIGYILVAVLVGFILLRGFSEIYDTFSEHKANVTINKTYPNA